MYKTIILYVAMMSFHCSAQIIHSRLGHVRTEITLDNVFAKGEIHSNFLIDRSQSQARVKASSPITYVFFDTSHICQFAGIDEHVAKYQMMHRLLSKNLKTQFIFGSYAENILEIHRSPEDVKCAQKHSGPIEQPLAYVLSRHSPNERISMHIYSSGNLVISPQIHADWTKSHVDLIIYNYGPTEHASILHGTFANHKGSSIFSIENFDPEILLKKMSVSVEMFSLASIWNEKATLLIKQNDQVLFESELLIEATKMNLGSMGGFVIFMISLVCFIILSYLMRHIFLKTVSQFKEHHCKKCKRRMLSKLPTCLFCENVPGLLVETPFGKKTMWMPNGSKIHLGSSPLSTVLVSCPSTLKWSNFGVIYLHQETNSHSPKLIINKQLSIKDLVFKVNDIVIEKSRYLTKGDKIEIHDFSATVL